MDTHRRGSSSRTTVPLAALVVVVITLVASFGTLLGPSSPISAPGTNERGAQGTVPPPTPRELPPVHLRVLDNPVPLKVNPTGIYSSEPAPMGIGDFGVGANGDPYSYNTTEFLGNFSWQSLSFDGSAGTSFTDQLNVVLQFVQNGVTYAYWIQDVAFMDSASNDLEFENNIWNMTTSQSCLANSALQGNGTVYSIGGTSDPCEGYYAVGATTQPGASLTMPNPGISASWSARTVRRPAFPRSRSSTGTASRVTT